MATKQYLDQAGVDAFWAKVKSETSAAQSAAEAKAKEAKDAADKVAADLTATNSNVSALSEKVTAMGSVLSFKGVKENASALPSTGNKTGDVWHVTDRSAEYVWDGSTWEELGSTIDLSGYAAKQHTHTASQITDFITSVDSRVPITSVKVNGTALSISSKAVNVTVATGTTNGSIKVAGTDISVKGLGTAAYTASSAYATAAQGAKADTALQPADIEAIPVSYIQALS